MAAGSPVASVEREDEAFRDHPELRRAIENYAAANLARYHALELIERWLVSDIGRASLSGAVCVLDGLGRLTPAALMASPPVTRGEVSRGRARLYLQRLLAHDLLVAADGAAVGRDTPLAPSPRFQAVMTGLLRVGLQAAEPLDPELGAAAARLGDAAFVQRAAAHVGRLLAAKPERFRLDRPVRLFQDRDGGGRMLEDLIVRQRPGRARLLESCEVSRSALARASLCSRAHVNQLLRDGEALGLLSWADGAVHAAPALSDDVERYFASFFFVVRTAARQALAEG